MANRQSARQRMINLMYLVFIAMMALNVSTEVLDGFDIINDNLNKDISNSTTRNKQLYSDVEESHKNNPVKTQVAYDKAQDVKAKTDSLYDYIQRMKLEIAIKGDGPDADINDLRRRDNIDAASQVMLSPVGGQGKEFKAAIDSYRVDIVSKINNPDKQSLVTNSLSTEPSERAKKGGKDWLTASFDRMPSIAVMSYLTGLQASVKQAEGEALTSLIRDIDFTDFRVNSIGAIVVPQSQFVMSGTPYKAQISLAAIDTTQRPRIVIGGKELPAHLNGVYTIPTGTPGTFSFSGFIEMRSRDGEAMQRPFKQEYTVMEPIATVAPLLMDVVYAGIDNPMSISVPGILDSNVRARATGGTLVQKGNTWIARPGKVGGKFIVEISANLNGQERPISKAEFRIRQLPDPVAYIEYTDANGALKQFKRGALSRTVLLGSKGIKAAIDDGILNIPFTVLGYRTIVLDAMGNAMPEVSTGGNFSQKQIAQFQRLGRGKTFFVSTIRVKGPDGIEREISPMEVRLN